MSEEKFDAIIVGGGLAGSTAAYVLAGAGMEVVVVERGDYSGSKNMTGGRLYGHSLEKLIPNFASAAPIERKVTKERISLMTDRAATTLDYLSGESAALEQSSYVVLRAKFDRWLAEQAENRGAMFIYGVRVDDLIIHNGKVCGIVAGDERMEADVVILADGVNSLLAQKAGLKQELSPDQVAVGVKEIIELGEKQIQDRFNLTDDDGLAWLFAGSCTGGTIGGGFLYTNRTSISLGIVTTVADIGFSDKSVPAMLDNFKNHDLIRPLIKGGTLTEYSAHLVPEGGLKSIPVLYRDGVLVTGDAANFVINIGYMVRGMDLAIESGRLAAETVIQAKERQDYSANTLSAYQKALDQSFVLKDLKRYRNFPAFMENHRIYNDYPAMVNTLMHDLFVVDGHESVTLLSKVRKSVKRVGILRLLKDAFKGVRAL